ncbi:MAG TPA: hypothetical protein VLE73_02025 [Candidatus Saccharimonadales bacterium]|nr:hypothetical protein [Candidatus Saccharimonadales bacterium]
MKSKEHNEGNCYGIRLPAAMPLFQEGRPVSDVHNYLIAQQDEARHVEADRMIGWAAVGAAAPFILDGYLLATE